MRSKLLELALEIEKGVPEASEVAVGDAAPKIVGGEVAVTNIFNQTIHGNYTGVTTTGDNAHLVVNVQQGDRAGLEAELTRGGLPEAEAREFAQIIAEEKPESVDRPFGARARGWIGQKVSSGAADVWKGGVAVGTSLMTKAALAYWGLA